MSAKHAVLGLVIERPSYGYELAQRLRERCGAWGWEPSGVYGALDLLEREEHVRSVRAKGSASGRRSGPRPIYEPTPKGLDFFRMWMSESSAPSPMRQELDLKLLFSGPEFFPALIDQTWAQEQLCLDDLRRVTSKMRRSSGRPRDWGEAAIALQRDAELKVLQVRIEWLQQVRTVMKEMLLEPGGGSARG